MDKNLIKEIGKETNADKGIGYFFFVTKISSLLFFLISFLVFFISYYFHYSIKITSFFLIILGIKSIIHILDGHLQGLGLIRKVTFLNILLNNFLKIIFFLVLYKLGLDKFNLVIISFILGEMICILFRINYMNNLYKTKYNNLVIINTKQKKDFLKYSFSLLLISGIGLFMKNIDKVMIGYFINNKSVGIYKVVQNYVSLISVFITPFIAFWPHISKLFNEDKLFEIEKNMKMIVKIVISLVIPMFFIFYFKSDKMLLVFGPEYQNSNGRYVLLILGFSFLIDAISGPIGAILTMTNYAKYVLVNNIISVLINIILNYFLIQFYGIIGVAIGTGISIIINNLLSIYQVKRILGIFSYDYKSLIYLISFSILNLIFGSFIFNYIKFDNLYIDLISFGIIIYLLNFLIIFYLYRNKIIRMVESWKVKGDEDL
jgi:O-antigen/teichoic acid export membrane protein